MMKLSDFFTDPDTGHIDIRKFWTNVSYAVSTAIFIWQAYTHDLTIEVQAIYLGVVGGSAALSEWIRASKIRTQIEKEKNASAS